MARTIRCAIVAGVVSSAAAISSVVSPPNARSVSGICADGANDGWQHSRSSASVSSSSETAAAVTSSRKTRSSRAAREASWRSVSVSRREATVSSQPNGCSGTSLPLQVRLEQRLLDGVLATGEVAVPADQRREHPRGVLAQRGVQR